MVGPRRGFQFADVGVGILGGNGGEGTATELRSGSDGSDGSGILLVAGWAVLSILAGVSSGASRRRPGGGFFGGTSPFPIGAEASLSLRWVEAHWSGGRMGWADGGGEETADGGATGDLMVYPLFQEDHLNYINSYVEKVVFWSFFVVNHGARRKLVS
jgi:hypothetical protein